MIELAREWQVWIAENLLRGVERAEIVTRLAAEQVPAELANAAIDAQLSSPLMEAARSIARDASRLTKLARRAEGLARLAAHPHAVLRRRGIDADELFDAFVATGTPVVIEGLPFPRIAPRDLAQRFGDVEVEITIRRENDADHARTFRRRTARLSMRDLVERIEAATEPTNDFYLVAQNHALEQPPLRSLVDELALPDGWLAPVRSQNDASLWMGPAGTVTPLHHDGANLLVLALHGRKRWRLIAPTERRLLARVDAPYTMLEPSSDALDGVLVQEVIVEAGEALFVPAGHWHHVVALDASITVSRTDLARTADFSFLQRTGR